MTATETRALLAMGLPESELEAFEAHCQSLTYEAPPQIDANALILHLRGCGNPDYNQYADVAPAGSLVVESLEQAVIAAEHYRDTCDLGGGNWAGGFITKGGFLVGYISYNGSLWQPASCEPRKWADIQARFDRAVMGEE